MSDLPNPEETPEAIVEVETPTADGLLRVELEQDVDGKVTRHEFFLAGKKITKKKALSLKKA